MRNLVICPGSSPKMYKKITKVTINTQREKKKPQNPNPTKSEAQQYTQESCENETPESTPQDFMNYRETRCENDCVRKKKKKKANKQKTHFYS